MNRPELCPFNRIQQGSILSSRNSDMRFWTMERRIILFLVFKVFMQSIHGQSPVLDIDDYSPAEGSSFTLNCSVAISDAIAFELENVAQGSCGAPFLGVLSPCTPTIIKQSLADAVTSWTISPALIAHRGSWKCTLGTTNSNVAKLTIHKLPVAVLTQNGISSNTTVNDTSSYPISIEVGCLFSENDPTVLLEFVAAGTTDASASMSCSTSSTSCSACTGCSAYSCSHNISQNQDLSGRITMAKSYTLQIKVGVTGTTQTFSSAVFSPHSIKFEGTSALTILQLGSNDLESTTYTLKCEIPGFDTGNQATWSKGNETVAIFVNGVNTVPPESPYSHRFDSSAIYVDFSTLEKVEHDIKWTCAYTQRTDVHFIVQVDSTDRVATESGVASAVAISVVSFPYGFLVACIRIVIINSAVAREWYFPNRHVFRGRVIYGLHIAIVGAVLQILSVIITLAVVLRYPGQFNVLVTVFIAFLFCITSSLGILVFCFIVAFFGKKELIHKIFDNKYERLSLKKSFGVKFNIHNSGLISFKIKTKKDAHIAVFGSNYGAPLVDIILGFRDKHRSVVMEPNQLLPKDEKRGEVISSTEYKTVNLKCEQNHLTLLNGNEETILTWKRDKNTSLEIKDIVISNSIKEHTAMTKKSISRFTERDVQGLCKTMSQKDKYSLENPEQDTTFWNDVCYSINQLHDKDDQRTADEIREMWEIILSASKWTLPGDSTCQFDSDSVLKSYSWIDTETEDEELESPGHPESGEWISLVRQGDRLDERDDDARCFKNFLLVIVVVFPIAWLVLLIIGLWRWCKKDDSTSNRENGIHECEYSCLRGSFCNKTSHLDKQKESSDNPPPYTVKYNRSDVPNKRSKKSQSVTIEGRDIENRENIENPSTGNDHDSPLAITVSTMGKEKGLKPITGVNTQHTGESKLNQKPFGTTVPLPSINSS